MTTALVLCQNYQMRFYINTVKVCALMCLRTTFSCAQETNTNTILPLSMSEVWQKTDLFSKAIQLKKMNLQASDHKVKDARFERLPELSVGGNIEKATNIPIYENGLFHKPTQHEVIHTLYKINAEGYLNLYNGGKTNLNIHKEEVLHQIAKEQQNLTVSETRLRAAAYYLELKKNLIYKDLILKDIADEEKQLTEIRQFQKHGVVLKSDVLRAELKLSRQKLTLVQIENDILLSNQKLNILIGESDDRTVLPVEPINPEQIKLNSYPAYLSEAIEKSYLYRISEKETEFRKLELRNVKANVSPRLGLYGDFYFANPQIFLYPYNPYLYSLGILGVKASFPISSLYHNRHKAKVAEIELLQQETEHANTQDELREQVKESYLRFKESIIRIEVARVNIDQATENFRIIRNTYFNQTSLITDLLDADVQLLETKFELASAQMSAQYQYFKLQNVIGNL